MKYAHFAVQTLKKHPEMISRTKAIRKRKEELKKRMADRPAPIFKVVRPRKKRSNVSEGVVSK